jgi:hypothetical protein
VWLQYRPFRRQSKQDASAGFVVRRVDREHPEMPEAQVPTVEEIRSRFGMIDGGTL